MVGFVSIFQKDTAHKLITISAISLSITLNYIKFGGVDITVTNIIADFLTTYLIIKSGKSIHMQKFNLARLLISFFLALSIFSLYSKPATFLIYKQQTNVNDIVVFYRFMDTIGETLVILIIGAIALLTKKLW
ncbi:MAG: hypothetical protein H6845_02085 [Alphaproteobacteria bacterium]|nr:MAG: hypothetical protein H6845_02085 [Alphaproteobacteria bacterium]